MADEGAANDRNAEHDRAPSQVDIEFVDSLPGDQVVMPLVEDTGVVLLVVKGEIAPQAGAELVAGLNHLVCSGLWPPR
ncbi:hypothetical protein [Streptomyces sp. NBC_00582]|uniref:hypothetical protein n=1 Tax=Streptomyces sp. NBC_00582 TaxID=2975783 RepID=UPI002E80ABAA|nr:hypothetical protein [Streptomyces sp. NBC_00582]WUB64481.1 hypothetical protein OG852_30835 [Streptomyces sp. NBC_00582]